MRFQGKTIFEKRPKIDRKSIRVRISSQSSDDFAFFPLSEATWDGICSLQGGSGLSWAPFLGPRRILEASWASPERPWDAPGALWGRSETLPGRLWSALGASRSILGRFWMPRAPPGSDFRLILESMLVAFSDCFDKRTASESGPILRLVVVSTHNKLPHSG